MLKPEYYLNPDVVALSRDLLGKRLITDIEGERCSGLIVETEAYAGPDDKASHAYGGRRTKRTEIMYAEGGVAYVYLCYGIHHLFNIVSNIEGVPHAVLVRAISPVEGIEQMLRRRGKKRLDKTLASGPGSVAQALGLNREHTGESLQGPHIWLEDAETPQPDAIQAAARVGIAYAEEHASLPWRFLWKP